MVWVVVLGGCFGSFLNVVAWRVPNGRGILGSSKCPFCNTKLSFFSNLPFYGWLSSAGRCRTCKLPIPIRYLIAELVLGMIFLLIAIVGLGCGGWYLPTRPVDSEWGILNFVLVPKFDLLWIVIYHLIVLCHLYLFALIRVQRLAIPKSIIASALIAAGRVSVRLAVCPASALATWFRDQKGLGPRILGHDRDGWINGSVLWLVGLDQPSKARGISRKRLERVFFWHACHRSRIRIPVHTLGPVGGFNFRLVSDFDRRYQRSPISGNADHQDWYLLFDRPRVLERNKLFPVLARTFFGQYFAGCGDWGRIGFSEFYRTFCGPCSPRFRETLVCDGAYTSCCYSHLIRSLNLSSDSLLLVCSGDR